jgi:KRAB domain-containing zinc finger protein
VICMERGCYIPAMFYKSFTQQSNLKMHHSEECAFICEACNKSFPEKSNLHIHQHACGGVRPLTCDVCNKSFMEQDNLKVHQSI